MSLAGLAEPVSEMEPLLADLWASRSPRTWPRVLLTSSLPQS